jgi:hypothetical protein
VKAGFHHGGKGFTKTLLRGLQFKRKKSKRLHKFLFQRFRKQCFKTYLQRVSQGLADPTTRRLFPRHCSMLRVILRGYSVSFDN